MESIVRIDYLYVWYNNKWFVCLFVQEMHVIATQPDLYELLVEHGAVESILQLLVHENTDIIAAVVNLLQVRRFNRTANILSSN